MGIPDPRGLLAELLVGGCTLLDHLVVLAAFLGGLLGRVGDPLHPFGDQGVIPDDVDVGVVQAFQLAPLLVGVAGKLVELCVILLRQIGDLAQILGVDLVFVVEIFNGASLIVDRLGQLLRPVGQVLLGGSQLPLSNGEVLVLLLDLLVSLDPPLADRLDGLLRGGAPIGRLREAVDLVDQPVIGCGLLIVELDELLGATLSAPLQALVGILLQRVDIPLELLALFDELAPAEVRVDIYVYRQW